METISGLSNWLLQYRREDDGIAILRALCCDSSAVLPDELFGLPVTRLGDHALAPGAPDTDGETLRITCGGEDGPWDTRGIRELRLPRPLRHIDDYAFLNLRAMRTLCLYDALRSTGSCSFMNCRAFSRLELTRVGPEQGPALAGIVSALPQELDVTLHLPGGERMRLIFPEYAEHYTENHAAHLFVFNIVGAGYPYHNVFRSKRFSVQDYDALWPQFLATEHEDGCALRLAWARLRWPHGLTEGARGQYAAYLAGRRTEAFSLVLSENDVEGLRLLLALGGAGRAELDAALLEARTRRLTEATAILLEARGHDADGAAKRFELPW